MKNIKVAPLMKIPNCKTGWVDKVPTYTPLINIASNIRSNNYNFEEEQLLGGDRIITRWYENDCYRETIEFRTENVNNQYYFIEYYEFDTRPDTPDIDMTLKSNTLVIDVYNKDNAFPAEGEHSKIVQRYKLYWKNAAGQDKFISLRDVIRDNITEDGIDKSRITEIISHKDPDNIFIPKEDLLYQLRTQLSNFGSSFGLEIKSGEPTLALRKEYGQEQTVQEVKDVPRASDCQIKYNPTGNSVTNMTGESGLNQVGDYTSYTYVSTTADIFNFKVSLNGGTPGQRGQASIQAADTESHYAWYYAIITKINFPVFGTVELGKTQCQAVAAYIENPNQTTYAAVVAALDDSYNP